MTLLITVANSRGVHQSSDYRLSDAGRPVQTENGAKQVSASGQEWTAQISFTGLARDGRGYDTREWLRDTLEAAGSDATLDEVVAAILARGNSALATVQSCDRRLSVVVGAVVGGRSRLFLVSNWESLNAAPAALARPTLEVNEIDLGRPRLLVNGFAGALPAWARKRLFWLQIHGSAPETLRDAIARANRLAAVNGVPYISEECWVQSLMANGRSAGKNYGGIAGTPSNINVGGIDLGQFIATEFPAAPGKQLTVLQSVGVRGGGTPAPTEIGEPKSIKFSSPTNALLLAASQGQGPFARVTVVGLVGDLVVSKNAWSDVTLAKVTVELHQDSAKWPKPFYRKRVPLRCVPIVDGGSPRTWDYSLDIRWDCQKLEIDIAQMSVALRSLNLPVPMPVLKATEELVMVAPSSTLSMVVTVGEPRAVAAIEARFLLREFPELLAPSME
jgi:hypothetical protein